MGFTTLGLSAALITFSKGWRASLRLAPPPRALLLRRDRPGGCSSQVPCVTAPCCLLSSCPCCCCWFGDWTRAQVALPRPPPPSRPCLSRPPSSCPPKASWRPPPACAARVRRRTADSARGRGGAGRGRRTGLQAAPGRPRSRRVSGRGCRAAVPGGGRAAALEPFPGGAGPGRRSWPARRCRGEGREGSARSGPVVPVLARRAQRWTPCAAGGRREGGRPGGPRRADASLLSPQLSATRRPTWRWCCRGGCVPTTCTCRRCPAPPGPESAGVPARPPPPRASGLASAPCCCTCRPSGATCTCSFATTCASCPAASRWRRRARPGAAAGPPSCASTQAECSATPVPSSRSAPAAPAAAWYCLRPLRVGPSICRGAGGGPQGRSGWGWRRLGGKFSLQG